MLFPSISECDLSAVSHRSIAADLDGTLLRASFVFPYYLLVAVEAGGLLRGLVLLLSTPFVALTYILVSKELARRIFIFVSFSGVEIRYIEAASRAVLSCFYAADVRSDSFEVFDSCERKVVVTANLTVMVEAFAKECLGADKVLGTEIEVNPKTMRATGFVKSPGILIGKWKKLAVLKEFGGDQPDIGIGDRKSDHDFMSICKVGYMVPKDRWATLVSLDRLKARLASQGGCLSQQPTLRNVTIIYVWLPFRFFFSIVRYTYGMLRIKLVDRPSPPSFTNPINL